jgi:hypothetical protein
MNDKQIADLLRIMTKIADQLEHIADNLTDLGTSNRDLVKIHGAATAYDPNNRYTTGYLDSL